MGNGHAFMIYDNGIKHHLWPIKVNGEPHRICLVLKMCNDNAKYFFHWWNHSWLVYHGQCRAVLVHDIKSVNCEIKLIYCVRIGAYDCVWCTIQMPMPIQREATVRSKAQTKCPILGAVSIRKTVLPGMAIPMLKIRRPNGRLIFNMEIAIRR